LRRTKKVMQSKEKQVKSVVTIVLILLMASVTLMVNMPIQAQLAAEQPKAGPLPADATPSITITTEAHLSFTPNPVGLGQTFLVNIWMHPPINVQRQFKQAFLVTITKPDETTIEVGPLDSYQGDGTAWFEYIADQEGTWKLKFDFLGMWYPAGRYSYGEIVANTSGTNLGSAYYKPSSTPELELVVQQEQVFSWPPSPLPTDYWTRPVNPVNREWWPILGSYPPTGVVGGDAYWPADTNIYMSNYNFVPYVQGPNSAHIVWKRELIIGGLIGGPAEQTTSTQPVNPVAGYPSIIYAGRVYDTYTKPGTGKERQIYWRCYDIRTGELYWERPLEDGESAPDIVEYMSQNEEVPGASARAAKTIYLVSISGGRILKYDPTTGVLEVNITGLPSGVSGSTFYADPYVLSVQRLGSSYRLINWTIEDNAGSWESGAAGRTVVNDFTARVKNNITWPFSSLGTCDFEAEVAVSASGIYSSATGTSIGYSIMAASLTTGDLLWNTTTDLSTGLETFFSGISLADHGKFAARMQNGQWYCWDLRSGKLLWKSELSGWPWGVFGAYSSVSAYGYIYSYDYVGVHAINWETGKIDWTFQSPTPYQYETPYQGYYSWHGAAKAADGKLYVYNGEHTPSQPVTRGWRLYCLNATTGEHIWDIPIGELIWNTIWFNLGGIPGSRIFQGAIADGYLVHTNEYDGYLYAFGKGKSATTIEAPLTAITLGQKVMLDGTVLDISPAQSGTPCVSKESMSSYMEYLHMQYPLPDNLTGVSVSLDTLDPNSNYVHIGDVTTDGYSGTFGFTWEPEVPGQYKVTATFMGDDSYGSSSATTYVTVTEVAATTEPELEKSVDYMPMMYAILAVGVIAIIMSAIAILLILRKH
jgi:outer membrane protein assembly factor BamB